MSDGPARLRPHSVRLQGAQVRLRPLTEDDWPDLLRWNQDPRVVFYADGGRTAPWSLEKLQTIYRGISEAAFMFVVERDALSVGECWLQEMNLEPIRAALPGLRLYRIDLAIGDPALWGRGWGTETIGLLVEFAFRGQAADAVFGCDVSDTNPRSRRAFDKNGFQEWGPAPTDASNPGGPSARHLWLPRARWSQRGPASASD